MTSTKKQICKLCLKTIQNNNYKTLEGDNKQILEVLLLQVNIKSRERCVICTDCMEMLQKCLDFKSRCLDVEDYISPCIKDSIKIGLVEVLQKIPNVEIDDDVELCRLCIDIIKDDIGRHLDKSEGQDLIEDLKNCLPEINLSAVNDPVVCKKCINFVSEYRSFQEKCKKLHNFGEKKDNNSNSKNANIQLNQNIDDLIENSSNLKDNRNGNQRLSSTENVEILSETQVTIRSEDMLKPKSGGKTTANSFEKKYQDDEFVNLHCLKTPVYQCNNCQYKTRRKPYLKTHMLSHVDPSKALMHECRICGFKTRYKTSLNVHMLVHMDPSKTLIHECSICGFKTQWKNSLKSHMLVHTDPSKTPSFECNICQYKTPRKKNLKSHMLNHRDPSKIVMYECNTCPYKTGQQHYLKAHMVVHMDPSEITMYECDTCQYKTKWKSYLRQHIFNVHRNSKRKNVFSSTENGETLSVTCDEASNANLQRRRNPLKTATYKCNTCPFKTLYKGNVKKHMLVHKEPSEKKYGCNICEFKTRRKYSLKRHMLVHMNPSERPVYECNSCPYKATRKRYLKVHKLAHCSSLYSCNTCRYKTHLKENLETHMLCHMNPSKIPPGATMYECNTCLYKTQSKVYLRRHIARRRH